MINSYSSRRTSASTIQLIQLHQLFFRNRREAADICGCFARLALRKVRRDDSDDAGKESFEIRLIEIWLKTMKIRFEATKRIFALEKRSLGEIVLAKNGIYWISWRNYLKYRQIRSERSAESVCKANDKWIWRNSPRRSAVIEIPSWSPSSSSPPPRTLAFVSEIFRVT